MFWATATVPAQGDGGGGCEITIGKGGNFPELSSELLIKLLTEHDGALCLCFLPGQHTLEGLKVSQRERSMRLSLHGCGPTAIVTVSAPIKLEGFTALEVRDLSLAMEAGAAIRLTSNEDVRLQNLQIAGRTDERTPWLLVDGTRDLHMTGCALATAAPASVVIQGITGVCEITYNQFEGDVAFYGTPPDEFPVRRLVDRLNDGDFDVPAGKGRMVFAHNLLPRLALGEEMLKQFLERKFEGLFHTVTLLDNTFTGDPVLCAGVFLNCVGNHFTSTQTQEGTLYGALVARRATASSNVGELFGDQATLWFLVTKGEFRGAANMVFTLPQSTP